MLHIATSSSEDYFLDNSVLLPGFSKIEMFAKSFLKGQITLLFQPTMTACTGFYLLCYPAIKAKEMKNEIS